MLSTNTAKTLNWHLRTRTLGPAALMLFPTTVVGRENIPLDEPFVCVVGPHKTMKETVLVPASIPEIEFHIMAKASLFEIPIFGTIFRNAGGIPVVRSKDKAAEAVAPAVEDLKNGYSVLNFPEGTRFPEDDDMRVGKTGPVRIALLAGVKILPIGLRNMMRRRSGVKPSIHIGELFDPRHELNLLQRLAVDKIPEGTAARKVTDRIMQRVATLADVDYIGQDERGGRA